MRAVSIRAVAGLTLLGLMIAACKSESATATSHSTSSPAPVKRAEPIARIHYAFAPAPDLATMEVSVCFENRVPARLIAQIPAARKALVRARHGAHGAELALAKNGIDLSALQPGDCADLSLDLGEAARVSTRRRGIRRFGRDVLVSPDFWLWKPSGSLEWVEITASFDLPEGMSALVPWPRPDPDGPYRVPATSFRWGIQAAFGHFAVHELAIGDARIQVAMVGDSWHVKPAVLLDWLHNAARAVSLLFDEFPVPRAHIILYPQDGDRVGFGWATQGGGPGVTIAVGTSVTAATLHNDWVAVHEMLHLGMPAMDDDGRWLSEGLATYYEPLLRARAGMLDADAPWEILHEGFGRGARQCQDSARSLRQDSESMQQTHCYWRVYWAGAAISLLADVALRERGLSLDQEIKRMRNCCLGKDRSMAAMELLRESALPARSHEGSQVDKVPLSFAAVAGPLVEQHGFPDLAPAYDALGLDFDDKGALRASQNALRHDMTAPAPK